MKAGGFLAIGQYTSHMSGMVSTLADSLALGDFTFMLSAASSIFAFLAGAASSAVLINWGRRKGTQSVYAMPLVLEALLLLAAVPVADDLFRVWVPRRVR